MHVSCGTFAEISFEYTRRSGVAGLQSLWGSSLGGRADLLFHVAEPFHALTSDA